MITEDAARIIGEFPLGTVASLTPDGRPAASPKGTFLVLDEMTLAYGDIRSPGTATNLRKTAMAEVVFVDVFRRKGVRIAGRPKLLRPAADASPSITRAGSTPGATLPSASRRWCWYMSTASACCPRRLTMMV